MHAKCVQESSTSHVLDGITPAVGEIAYVSGRVLTKSGEPLRNGYVEIWQTDTNGSYLHSGNPLDGKGTNAEFVVFLFVTSSVVLAPGRIGCPKSSRSSDGAS